MREYDSFAFGERTAPASVRTEQSARQAERELPKQRYEDQYDAARSENDCCGVTDVNGTHDFQLSRLW
jgi:hypothetical protein